MHFRTTGIIATLAFVLCLSIPAASLAQGQAGAAILQIPQGPRAEGMGRFFVSVAEGPFAAWWNPAGLANMQGWNAGLMHVKLVPDLANDVYFDHLGGNKYLEGWGGVHGSFTYLNYGSTEATEGGGDSRGLFSAFEWAASAALGTHIFDNLSMGVGLKVVHVNLVDGLDEGLIDGGVGTAFGTDIGVLYQKNMPQEDVYGQGPGNLRIGLGAVASNLGPKIQLNKNKTGDPLPRQIRFAGNVQMSVPEGFSVMIGAGMDKSLIFQETKLTEAEKKERNITWLDEQDILLHGGLEIGITDTAFGRFGYIYDDPGEVKNITYGFGFLFDSFALDVASIPQSETLDRVWKFSIGYQSKY